MRGSQPLIELKSIDPGSDSCEAVGRGATATACHCHGNVGGSRRPAALRLAKLLAFSSCCSLTRQAAALDNGAGALPALGWSSWNAFEEYINEEVILENADALIATGLSKLGFKYINIDAGSMSRRRDSKTGKLFADPAKFPRGMRALADSIHAKGLLLGVYTDISNHGCGTGPGSQGHYQIDADTYAHDWQVDYLKVDFCGPTNGPTGGGKVSIQPGPQYAAFKALGDALNATNRSIYYSICPDTSAPALGTAAEWATHIELGIDGFIHCTPTEWTAAERLALANSLLIEYTNTWDAWYLGPERGGMIGDIDSMLQMTDLSYGRPGSWNDADMLQVCNYGKGKTPGGGMTLAEYRAHYAVWAVLASPLILGVDLRTLAHDHPDCLELILNPEIVAVNQDPAARAPALISQTATPPRNRAASVDGTHALRLVPCNSSAVEWLPWKLELDHSMRAGGSAEGCLDAFECSTTDGTRVSVFPCHPNNTCPSKLKGCMCGYKNQQWNATGDTIRNGNSSACLTVRNAANVQGRDSLILSKCDGSAAQRFTFDEADGKVVAGGVTPPTCVVASAHAPQVPPAGGPTSLDITTQVFARPMGLSTAQDIAVVMLNRAEASATMSVTWAELGISPGQHMRVRDIVNRKDLPMAVGGFNATVDAHDVAFVRFTQQ